MEIFNNEVLVNNIPQKSDKSTVKQSFDDYLFNNNNNQSFSNVNHFPKRNFGVGITGHQQTESLKQQKGFDDSVNEPKLTIIVDKLDDMSYSVMSVHDEGALSTIPQLINDTLMNSNSFDSPLIDLNQSLTTVTKNLDETVESSSQKIIDSYLSDKHEIDDVLVQFSPLDVITVQNQHSNQSKEEFIAISVLWGSQGVGYLSYSERVEVNDLIVNKQKKLGFQTSSSLNAVSNKVFTSIDNFEQSQNYIRNEFVGKSAKSYSFNDLKKEKIGFVSLPLTPELRFKTILPQFLQSIAKDEKELKVFARDYFLSNETLKKISEWIRGSEEIASKQVQMFFNGKQIKISGRR